MLRRALISVSDKTGVVPFARALSEQGVEILSTGGTLRALTAEGVKVTSVEAYTASPEVMAGRVKTLHPRIHGGILAREGQDDSDLQRLGAGPIDLVACNLYPFEATLARDDADHPTIVENIDIGGPSMLRSAAKNHARVTVLCDPADYDGVIAQLTEHGEVPAEVRASLAAKAFAHTAAYDGAIAGYLSAAVAHGVDEARGVIFPPVMSLQLERVATLRYGENPHQQAAWYRDRAAPAGSVARAQDVGRGNKGLSFNNLVDLNAAMAAVLEHERPAAAVIKHTNPCGLAVHEALAQAYVRARAGDPTSAFGGIVALNRSCDLATAELIAETFIECVVAPGFDADARKRLRRKKNLRLVAFGERGPIQQLDFKRIDGGFVVQSDDHSCRQEVAAGRVVSQRQPDPTMLRSLDFAWRVCKHVKSNAIVLVHATSPEVVGTGAGQMSRVDAVMLACRKAGERASGAVLASDAFFPFPDGVRAAAEQGVIAVVQPGGSVKDDDVIAAADELGLVMVFTGARHFRH